MVSRGLQLRRRVPLFARWPRVGRFRPVDDVWPEDWPVVGPEHLERFPALAEDLQVWIEVVEPRFRRLDHTARLLQNQFWRQHLGLIVGGLVATALGAVQAASGAGLAWLGAVQAVLAGLLAGITVLVRSRRAQHGFLDARLKAERIKSEFHLFLARAGIYADDARRVRLVEQVDEIETTDGAA